MANTNLRGQLGTDAVVNFASGLKLADVPAEVLNRTVDAFTDTIGVLLGGSVERSPQFVLEYLKKFGQIPGRVSLLGLNETATPSGAALFHGSCAHALDYDDTGHPGNVHPSSHVVAALLSLANFAETTGEEFIVAYLIGLEVENKIGMCLPSAIRNLNTHPTGVIGPLAATAAGSRLVSLNPDEMRMAFGISGSFGAGIRANNGTDVKALHAARAAESAVVAVHLAKAGAMACPAILDAEYGFMDAFRADHDRRDMPDLTPMLELGQTWEFEKDYGIALKPYPCCACIHPGIEAALRIANQVEGPSIQSVAIATSEYAYSIVADPNPDTYTRARFSMQYCVSTALIKGVVNLATFTDKAIEDPEVRSLMKHTTIEVAEELRDDLEHPAVVTVTLVNGRVLREFVPFASGKPASWLSKEALEKKFHDCTSAVLCQTDSEILFKWLQDLPKHALLADLPTHTVASIRQ